MKYTESKSAAPALSAASFGLNTEGMPMRHEAKAQMASIAQENTLKDHTFLLLLSHGVHATLFPVDEQANLRDVLMKYTEKHDILQRDLDFTAVYHRGSCIASVSPNGKLNGLNGERLDSLSQAREQMFGPRAYVHDSIRFYALAETLKSTPGWTSKLDAAVHSAGNAFGIDPKEAAVAALDLLKGKAYPADFSHPVIGPFYADVMKNIANAFPEHYDALLKDAVLSIQNIAPQLHTRLPTQSQPELSMEPSPPGSPAVRIK